MILLILQTAMLLLAAYVLGAICGCWLHRLLASPVEAGGLLAATGSGIADQPMIEVTAGPPPPIPGLSAANRFERALIGPRAIKPPEAVPALEEAAASPTADARPAPETVKPQSEAAELAAEPEPELEPEPEPMQPALEAAGPEPEPAKPEPEKQEQPAPFSLPAATGSGGVIGTSAPLAPASQQSADDLTRIRGIDAETASRLAGLGVSSYARLAAFTRADIDRVEASFGQRRISRENWIEQAQLLANGRATAFARRLAGEEAILPGSAEIYAGHDLAGEAEPTAEIAGGNDPDAGERVPLDVAPLRDIAEPEPKPEPVDPASEPPAQPAELAEPADELACIRGLDAAAEEVLHANGVHRFEEIARWRAPDVLHFEDLLRDAGRIRRENWIEQAQILATGGETAFSRRRRHEPAIVPYEAAPLEQHEPSTAAPAASTAPDREGEPEVAVNPGPSHLAALRSVRSPLLTGNEAASSTGSDDLKRIRGIGLLIEKQLNSLGISRYGQIANWTAAEVARISQILDFKGRIERESWIEQARILASGGQTQFSSRVDRE